jgi:hypothetical protein
MLCSAWRPFLFADPCLLTRKGRLDVRSDRILLVCVCFLGVIGVCSCVGVIVCAVRGVDVPAALAAVVGTCLGALGGLLTQPPPQA